MKYFLFLLFFMGSRAAQAQVNPRLDSLLKAVDTEKEDSVRLKALTDIGNAYTGNNNSKALEYFERSAALAKKINDSAELAYVYVRSGYCWMQTGNYTKSLGQYQQAARLYEQMNDSRRLANTCLAIVKVHFDNKNPEKGKDYLNKAEQVVMLRNDSAEISSLYNFRGELFGRSGMYDSALHYHTRAMNIAHQSGRGNAALTAMVNVGLTYKHLNNTAMALQHLKAALQGFLQTPGPPLQSIAVTYNNLGATYAQAGLYQPALEAFNKSIEYAGRGGFDFILMENYKNMADMYAAQNGYRQQAVYLQKYYALKDSVFSAGKMNQLTQLEADYQLEKKNRVLALQLAETARQKSQRNVFIIIAAGAVLLLGLLGYFYKRIRQKNKSIQLGSLQIQRQNAELETLNGVKDRLFSVIGHDLRSPVAALKTYLALNESGASAHERQQIKGQIVMAVSQTDILLDNLLTWANMQIKNSAPAIVPVPLEECVDDAVDTVAAQAQHKNIVIEKRAEAAVAAADRGILEIALRNLLTNAIKYSHEGGKIAISSRSLGGAVQIEVADTGIGMEKELVQALMHNEAGSRPGTRGEKGSGMGLFLVKELLQSINGQLLIESEPGKGSRFTVVLGAC